MYVIAPVDRSPGVVPEYERACYTCLVSEVSRASVNILEGESLQAVLPRATGWLLLGDDTEEMFQDVTTPCRFCGRADGSAVEAGREDVPE